MNKIAEVLWNLIETIVRAVFGVILKIAHKELNEEQWETLFQFVKFGLVGVWNTIFNYVIYLVSLIALQGAGIDKMTVLGFDNAPVAVWIATAIRRRKVKKFWKSLIKDLSFLWSDWNCVESGFEYCMGKCLPYF